MTFNALIAAQINVECIKIVKKHQMGVSLSKEDTEILRSWKSWGGCAKAFDPNQTDQKWKEIQDSLEFLLSDSDKIKAMDTTINAHFTNPDLVKSIIQLTDKLLPNGGKALEIGCGSGTFIRESDSDKWRFTGIEIDPTTAKIAEILCPESTQIINLPIEETQLDDSSFDLVIGNVPFASYAPYDKTYNPLGAPLHDYCLMRGIHALKDGGIMAVITSRYTLDKKNSEYREWFAEQADLLFAYRLPDTAHKEYAGTSAVTDLLVFRKKDASSNRIPKLDPEKWKKTFTVQLSKEPSSRKRYNQSSDRFSVDCNAIFQNFDNALSTIYQDKIPSWTNSGDGHKLRVCSYIYPHYSEKKSDKITDPAWIQIKSANTQRAVMFGLPFAGGMYANSDLVVKSRTNIEAHQYLDEIASTLYAFPKPQSGKSLVDHSKFVFEPPIIDIPESSLPEYTKLVQLKEVVKEVLHHQEDNSLIWDTLIIELKTTYNEYVATFGNLSRKRNRLDSKTWGLFQHDPEWTYVGSLEHFDEDKDEVILSKIFTEKVISKTIPNPQNIREAINVSNLFKGEIDPDYIAGLLSISKEEALSGIEEFAFIDPDNNEFVLKNVYLSGDVINKLEIAKMAVSLGGLFERNIEALESVQPKKLGPGEFDIAMGLPWIAPTIIESFIDDLRKSRNNYSQTDVSLDATGSWSVKLNGGYAPPQYNGLGITFQALITDILNGRQSKVYYVDDDGKRHLDVEKTALARNAAEEIKLAFCDWAWADLNISKELCDVYNSRYNRTVVTKWDGSYLTDIDGMSSEFTLMEHQRNCIDKILQSGNTLVGHPVGAGKTAVIATSAILGKARGLFNKPLIVVPNLAVENFSIEFRRMFPLSKILTYGQTTEKIGRQEFIGMAAIHDWDAIIMPLSVFERIPISEENKKLYVEEKISKLRAFLKETEDSEVNSGNKTTVKKLVSKIKSLEVRYAKMLDSAKDKTPLSFEDMGVDCLFIDEIQEWKNLPVISNLDSINGAGSKRSVDLESKISWLRSTSKSNLYICGATGTHVSNAVWELWVIWNYIDRESLVKYGFDNIDAWMKQFSLITSSMEVKADGNTWELKTRVSGYTGVKTLMRLVSKWADLLIDSDLKLPVPEIHGGAPSNYAIEPSDSHLMFTQSLTDRMKDISAGLVEPWEDNMLVICNDGRKCALDLRLVDMVQDDESSKIHHAANMINEIYLRHQNDVYLDKNEDKHPVTGALQLVFCDLSTPSSSWNVYEELKNRIASKGNIPLDKIRFVHEFKNPVLKKKMLEMANSGGISVLIGSTAKMGTALNIQSRLAAIHHLDPPWRPSDIKQRDGRGVRQGNQNKKISIFRYLVKNSFDIFYWQTLERKKKFVEQVSIAEPTVDQIEEIDMGVLSYTQSKAIATGNPLLIELAELEAKLKFIESRKKRHTSHKIRMEKELVQNNETIDDYNSRIDLLKRFTHAISLLREVYPLDNEEITSINERVVELSRSSEVTSGALKYGAPISPELLNRKSPIFGILDLSIRGNYSIDYGSGDKLLTFCLLPLGQCFDVKEILGIDHPTLRKMLEKVAISFQTSQTNHKPFSRLLNALEKKFTELNDLQIGVEKFKESCSALETQIAIPFKEEEELIKMRLRYDELNNAVGKEQNIAA